MRGCVPHDGPGVFVPATDRQAAHYVKPGGPGLGEPDFFEHVGLAAWREWELMGGRSPNYDQKLVQKEAVIEKVRRSFGKDLPIRVGYGIDLRLGGGSQGVRQPAHGVPVIPIPGTTSVSHLRANVAAADLSLSDDELRRLDSLPAAA